ncbi:phage tail length tape measure family protein [Rhodoplanes serenus]|uniref:phage tail length tape measure family protein n=1 Tax=Rhodoplanes serenus TaxID=200615 RepID=UPI000DAC8D09|nr:phage tail length tape measure family protein [Rhodoplanes serenus]RAI34522.1 hypothetical protein CH340_08830 [Rhodoplanes serenus]
MDIASLGLSIDSAPAERAAAALNRLVPAAQNAAAGVGRLDAANRALSAGAESVAGAAEREMRALTQSTVALNDNARAAQVAGSARRAITQQMVNSFAGVRDSFGGTGRADDIAAYGAEMDRLRAKFNPLFAASRQYRSTLDEIGQAAKVGAISERERADAIQRTKDAFASQVRAISAVDRANAKMASGVGLARHELINLSRQVQDVGVSLVSGQSPFTILVQQGAQIGDIFASSQGSVRGFASQVAGLITPVTALTAGAVALGAAVYAGITYWKSYALALDDTARAAGVSSSEMSKLQAVASFRGISQEDSAAGMGRFAAEVYRAERGMGSLAELMAANGKSASGFSDYLEKAADIIKNAASDQQRLQLLQQAGLPATMEWVRLLSGGADGLRRAKEEAVAFGGAANDNLVAKAREFDEAWNRAWTNFGLRARTTVLDIIDYFDQLNQSPALKAINAAILNYLPAGVIAQKLGGGPPNRFDQAFGSLGNYSNPPLQAGLDRIAGKAGSSVDPASLRQQMALEQQRIQMLGELATVEERVLAKELEIAQARLNSPKLPLTDDDVRRIMDYARAQEKANELARAAGVMGEAASYAERYAAEMAAVNAALRGTIITQEQYNRKVRDLQIAEDISRARDRIGYLGDAATETDRYALRVRELDRALQDSKITQEDYNRALISLNPAFRSLKESAIDFTFALVDGLAKGRDMADVLESALRSLSSSMIRAGTQNLMGSLFQGVGANGQQTGGLLGGGLASMFGLGATTAGPLGALAGIGLGVGASLLGSLFGGNDEEERRREEEARQREQERQRRIADYQFRAATAGLDTSTQEGALRRFDLDAARQRQQEQEAGAGAMAELERALAAERMSIIDDFARRAAEKEKEIARRRQDYLDRVYRTTLDTSTIYGRLAEFDLAALREREQEIERGGQALVDLERAQAAERGRIVRDAMREQTDYYDSFRRQIASFTSGLSTGNLSALSPAEQLMAARNQFQTQYDLALSGDRTAQSGITGVAQTLLEQARSYYGPTAQYADLMQRVTDQLGALPNLAMAQDPQVTELQRLGSDYFDPMVSLLGQIAVNTGGTAGVTTAIWAPPTGGAVNDNSAVVGVLQAITTQLAEVKAELQAARAENAMLQGAVARLQAEGNNEVAETRGEVVRLNRDLRQAITALGV